MKDLSLEEKTAYTFSVVEDGLTFADQEEKVLNYWKEHKCFEESLKQSKAENRPVFTFYDGPPFATGK